MRVFCTEGSPPPLEKVIAWTANRGVRLRLDTEMLDVDPASGAWDQAAVEYRQDKLPFLSELNRVGDPETDAAEEIEEFVELLEDLPESPEKQRVVSHLQRTTFVIANQIPTADFVDEGYEAVGEFMRFFAEHHGGIIQADGQGFYDADRLIVRL